MFVRQLKRFFKWMLIGLLLSVSVLGIYRKDYLVQAFPVYLQYLEQKKKWENYGAKSYILFYGDTCLPTAYYFIENNRLKYIYRHDTMSPDMQNLLKGEKLLHFISHGSFCQGFKKPEKVLIEARFKMIEAILWDKLWEDTVFENPRFKYPVEIGYDLIYGYPVGVFVYGGGSDGCLRRGNGKPYWLFFEKIIEIFSDDTILTPKNAIAILYRSGAVYKKQGKVVGTVGGSSIKGMVIAY